MTGLRVVGSGILVLGAVLLAVMLAKRIGCLHCMALIQTIEK